MDLWPLHTELGQAYSDLRARLLKLEINLRTHHPSCWINSIKHRQFHLLCRLAELVDDASLQALHPWTYGGTNRQLTIIGQAWQSIAWFSSAFDCIVLRTFRRFATSFSRDPMLPSSVASGRSVQFDRNHYQWMTNTIEKNSELWKLTWKCVLIKRKQIQRDQYPYCSKLSSSRGQGSLPITNYSIPYFSLTTSIPLSTDPYLFLPPQQLFCVSLPIPPSVDSPDGGAWPIVEDKAHQ